MSAPNTDPERQTRRHRTPLIGIAAAVIFALVLLFALMTWVFAEGDEPRDAPEIDVGSGAAATE